MGVEGSLAHIYEVSRPVPLTSSMKSKSGASSLASGIPPGMPDSLPPMPSRESIMLVPPKDPPFVLMLIESEFQLSLGSLTILARPEDPLALPMPPPACGCGPCAAVDKAIRGAGSMFLWTIICPVSMLQRTSQHRSSSNRGFVTPAMKPGL